MLLGRVPVNKVTLLAAYRSAAFCRAEYILTGHPIP